MLTSYFILSFDPERKWKRKKNEGKVTCLIDSHDGIC